MDEPGRPDARHRTVITGVGALTSLGTDSGSTWSALLAGRGGLTRVAGRIPELPEDTVAGLVDGFDAADRLGRRTVRGLDRFALLGLAAAQEAWASAGAPAVDPRRLGVVVGSGLGGLDVFATGVRTCRERGPGRVSPYLASGMLAGSAAGAIARWSGATGPCTCPVTACAAGANALGEARDHIRLGRCDVVIAGGCEAPLVAALVAGMTTMGALSRSRDPVLASRPFDVDRDGLVLAEAAGMVVVESEAHARARGAAFVAELAGYGASCDAFHPTAPDPTGSGAARAMREALSDAGVAPAAVGWLNAHGTSTPLGDAAELRAVAEVFGALRPPLSSIKSMTGHSLGAAGAVEAVASVLALRDGVIPPTATLRHPDAPDRADHVAGVARAAPDLKVVLSNSFGFGGHNASLVFRRR